MPREINFDTITFEVGKRQIAYSPEFRRMLLEHPGITRAAIKLADEAEAEYNPGKVRIGLGEFEYDPDSGKWLEQRYDYQGKPARKNPMSIGRGMILAPGKPKLDSKTGAEVLCLGRSNRELGDMYSQKPSRLDVTSYFKMMLGGESFFVKKSLKTTNLGLDEFKATAAAQEVLEGLDNVRVVEMQLGYQDKKQSWYVSKWEELEGAGFVPYDSLAVTGFDDYGKMVSSQEFWLGFESEEEYEEVKEKVNIIKRRLEQASLNVDVDSNLFYNRQTKTFILLDLTNRNAQHRIGQQEV